MGGVLRGGWGRWVLIGGPQFGGGEGLGDFGGGASERWPSIMGGVLGFWGRPGGLGGDPWLLMGVFGGLGGGVLRRDPQNPFGGGGGI